MPFPFDGVYTIKNTGRDLMLDLKNNSTAEGNQIQGYLPNGTVAQQWVIKRQNEPGSRNKTVTIQSNNSGNNGNGCFTAASDDSDEPLIYTRQMFMVDLIGRADNTYTMNFTQGSSSLVLSIPNSKHSEVKLENFVLGSSRQQWEFTRVSDLREIAEPQPLDNSLQWWSRLSFQKCPRKYILWLLVSASVIYYVLFREWSIVLVRLP
ncbi:hypothetical protein EDD22DRAFT_989648 [Suillus occidentalis]|nr:hypothetical protein EDD22DRAFT_989648 [Suillus occidentalis]